MTDLNDILNSIPFDLTETDRENLLAGDENFKPHTWEDLKVIIGETHHPAFPSLQKRSLTLLHFC